MVTPESSVNSKDGGKPKPRVRSERKKLQDRLAQRATREKTKGRIALLEQTLSSLRADDKQSEIASLIRTIDSLQNKNNRLQSAINKIRNALDPLTLAGDDDYDFKIEIKPCGCSVESACSCSRRSTPLTAKTELVAVSPPQNLAETVHPPSGVTLTTKNQTEEHDDFVDDTGAGSVKIDQDENLAGFCHLDNLDFDLNTVLDVLDHSDFHSWNGHTPSPFDIWSIPLGSAGRIAPDTEKWHVSNRAYSNALNARKQVKSATMLDLQVPFKAAIWGWESVGPEAEHPVWDALRQVDQRVFGIWTSKAQRIAMMYVCQTLIQYRENPTPENLAQVPGFLQPRYASDLSSPSNVQCIDICDRPAQERFEHPVVIDFLIWYVGVTFSFCLISFVPCIGHYFHLLTFILSGPASATA